MRGRVYTAHQVLKDLELLDTPFFCFEHEGGRGVVQTSHLRDEELLMVPGFADSWWRYQYTTNEWIPIFEFVLGLEKITDLVDLVRIPEEDEKDFGDRWWATPKGFPREYVSFSRGE
jgi:hypothetical protein